jgi:hypothetical protein
MKKNGNVIEGLDEKDTSTEGKDVMVLLVFGLITILFVIVFQIFLSILVNNPKRDYIPDEKLMMALRKGPISGEMTKWYFRLKLLSYIMLVIILILYISAVGIGNKFDFKNDVVIMKKDFVGTLNAVSSLSFFLVILVVIIQFVRLCLNAKYYEEVSSMDTFLNIDALALWWKTKNQATSIEGECLDDEQKKEWELTLESNLEQPGSPQTAYDESSNVELNLANIFGWSWYKHISILVGIIFVIYAFIFPMISLSKFKFSKDIVRIGSGKRTPFSQSQSSARFFIAVITIIALLMIFALLWPIGSYLSIKTRLDALFGTGAAAGAAVAGAGQQPAPIGDLDMLERYQELIDRMQQMMSTMKDWKVWGGYLILAVASIGVPIGIYAGAKNKALDSTLFKSSKDAGTAVFTILQLVIFAVICLMWYFTKQFSKMNIDVEGMKRRIEAHRPKPIPVAVPPPQPGVLGPVVQTGMNALAASAAGGAAALSAAPTAAPTAATAGTPPHNSANLDENNEAIRRASGGNPSELAQNLIRGRRGTHSV